VPLVLRAVELWDELGALSGESLFHRIGSLDVSAPEGAIFNGSLRACEAYDIAHEVLTAAEIKKRHPALHPDETMMGVFQPGSGFLLPEASVTAHANLAMIHGAEIHGHERLLGWEKKGDRFELKTDRATYEAGQVIFTTGAWIGKLLDLPVEAERTVLGWFSPLGDPSPFSERNLPVWIVDSEECGHFYGFPIHGIPGFKLGRLRDHPSPSVDPNLPRVEPNASDEADMREFISRYFPRANGPILSMAACFFENTPDRSPIIDSVPGVKGAWVLGGFSGHGFKYATVMGEIARELVTTGTSSQNLKPFKASRFSTTIQK
jgi:sarcosine oxidase